MMLKEGDNHASYYHTRKNQRLIEKYTNDLFKNKIAVLFKNTQ